MQTFTCVDDKVLTEVISRARNRLVFVSPGVRSGVVEALVGAMQTIPSDSIHLVFDVDAEVCRLGYGDPDFKGMEKLQAAAVNHGFTINHQPGVRIGLLIADETTIVYCPTPELIESESRQASKPNAIRLDGQIPTHLADACALGDAGVATLEVGNDPIRQDAIEEVKQDLAERPPKEFNVARIERVFSSMLHFVEFRIENYKLASRSVALKPELFGVNNQDVIERLSNRYRLFANTDALSVDIPMFTEDAEPLSETQKFTPRSIDKERLRIKKRFIAEAGDMGLIILRKDVPNFEKELKVLEAKIAAYKTAVQEEIQKRTKEIVAELLAALKEALKQNPPEIWRGRYLKTTPSDADIERLFYEDVSSEVDRVNTDFNPRVFHAFKDVTYHTFKNKQFRDLLEKRFGKESIDKIFNEYDAVPESAARRQP